MTVPYQKEQLQEWCKTSHSYNEVLVKAGRTKASSTRETLKKYIALYGIDISHFDHKTIASSRRSMIDKDGMKICSQCGEQKDAYNDFYWSNGKTRSICKECVKANERRKYANTTQEIDEYKKSHSCKKCGEKRFYLLDFHHRNPLEKDFTISDKVRMSLSALMPEIEKCDLLCSNCHREWHYLFEHGLIKDYQQWLDMR